MREFLYKHILHKWFRRKSDFDLLEANLIACKGEIKHAHDLVLEMMKDGKDNDPLFESCWQILHALGYIRIRKPKRFEPTPTRNNQ